MGTWILVIVLATSSGHRAGAASVISEFNSESACKNAGQSLVDMTTKRSNYVLTWGCFKK